MMKANPINITAIDHVVIRVVDLETMVAFYQEVLGMRLERGPGKGGLAQLRAGLSLLDLVDVAGPLGRIAGDTPERKAPNMDHLCLRVDPWDTDRVIAHLSEHAVDFDPVGNRYGATGQGPSIYLRDPEGNTVELKGTPHGVSARGQVS